MGLHFFSNTFKLLALMPEMWNVVFCSIALPWNAFWSFSDVYCTEKQQCNMCINRPQWLHIGLALPWYFDTVLEILSLSHAHMQGQTCVWIVRHVTKHWRSCTQMERFFMPKQQWWELNRVGYWIPVSTCICRYFMRRAHCTFMPLDISLEVFHFLVYKSSG